ncbi:putative metal tolerance protein C3 [Punica granatum]|uniref:Metal tolerance protein C3 n=1 Tax=Punica granatum TaxID=22663 RepID=A0A6P8CBY4_PUNGR|nr:putative metal tolerance protein C3 [Punica granatum]
MLTTLNASKSMSAQLDIFMLSHVGLAAQHERAMKISNWANMLLLAFKIYATVRNGSLAIAASTLDSLLDLMAGGILWFTHLSMKSININKYPIGKSRVQPVRIIIFVAVMTLLGNNLHPNELYSCRYCFLLDPHGGFGVLVQAVEQLIRDKSAPPEVLQKLTYLILRHDPQIKRVDTVRAYTFGVLYSVEVDIELSVYMLLKEAHAIRESLQIKIEDLPEVERAFVHLDYECDHKPEHSVLIRLPSGQH